MDLSPWIHDLVWSRIIELSKFSNDPAKALKTGIDLCIYTYLCVWHCSASDQQFVYNCIQVESKLKETTQRLEKQLAEEQAARLEAEKLAHAAQMRSSDEIQKLRESLEKAKQETEDLRKRAESGRCAILW